MKHFLFYRHKDSPPDYVWRAGPFPNRAAAVAAMLSVKEAYKAHPIFQASIDAIIFDIQPEGKKSELEP